MSGSGPYSGGGSDTESTGGGGGGSGGGNGGSGTPGGPGSNPAMSASAASAVASAADQVKSMLELQHNQLPGSYGLYRPPYGNNQQPGTPDPGAFGRAGHLGGYPFAPMPGQNPYTGYNHLGYPTSQSPVRDGKELIF